MLTQRYNMKHMLNFFAISLSLISFSHTIASEAITAILQDPNTAQVIVCSSGLNLFDVAALKQTCTKWNASLHYYMIHPDIIESIDKLDCTTILYRFAHDTEQEKNFLHFFRNN